MGREISFNEGYVFFLNGGGGRNCLPTMKWASESSVRDVKRDLVKLMKKTTFIFYV